VTTDQFLAALSVAHRAADSASSLSIGEIRIQFPFDFDGKQRWHCVIASYIDDDDERHYSGEFIGIGDSPQDALSSAIVHATDTIITRAERDRGFIDKHIPEVGSR